MGNDIENKTTTEKQLLGNTGELGMFAMKAGIVLVLLLILGSAIFPDLSQLQRFETPMNKLYLLSFVQNPRALLKISEIEEADGKTENSIREVELAIGLLEMHGADKQTIQHYNDRLNMLKIKK
jgi:hypothetical protein